MASYTIEDIELIRKKSGISYQEAVALLDYHNGNVARALVDLERNGRIKPESQQKASSSSSGSSQHSRGTLSRLLSKFYRFRLKVKKGDIVIANLSLLFSLLALMISPHLVIIAAILILVLAWTLKGMVDQLDIATFVNTVFAANSSLAAFMPMLMFLVACFLGFSTGTSWGTMGIMIPIAVPMFYSDSSMLTISIAAIMAGAVCGDHISPISDTTIMSSTGAQCNHLNHVATQMQYAIVIIAISAVMYLLAGFVHEWYIVLPIGIVVTIAVLFFLRSWSAKRDSDKAEA